MSFLIDKIREKLDTENDTTKGFAEMNYEVGNTSGLDVANIPTPIDQRIGSQAQLGGSVMEVKVSNPSTFQIEKPEMVNVIEQLGIDISLHSDLNTGYCSPYKTRGQGAQGFEPVHDYFTRYLRELARFKNEVDERDDLTFKVKRVNPHASTSLLPPLNERMAQDVGLDPFGYKISDLKESSRLNTNKNIFDNEEFLKKFYHTFLLDEVNEPYQIYQLFSRFSPKFRDDYWRAAQAKACNNFWVQIENFTAELEGQVDPLEEKISMIQSVRMSDQGISTEWLNIVSERELENSVVITPPDGNQETEITTLEEASAILGSLAETEISLTRIQILSETYFALKNLEIPPDNEGLQRLREEVINTLENALDSLWIGDERKYIISVESKISALNSRLDIQQQEILERAQQINPEEGKLEKAAEQVMMGKPEYFEIPGEGSKSPEQEHMDMLDTLLSSFEQAMWMESNLFYRIIPCWMSSSEETDEDHKGWEAPKFIWDTIVKRRWEDKIDIDLTNPDEYFDALENHREFLMDVSAASAACYMWGHFTQKESDFQISGDHYMGDVNERCTWAEWMNKFGIGVNMETMAGSHSELFKLWRPKDIAVAARAINMTTDKIFEEKDIEWHEELYNAIVKFTIDMEHVASLGADPEKEMKLFIEQEKELAESEDYNLNIDKEKPLADILRMVHLMKAGVEAQQGTRHGPFMRGEKTLYKWLYMMVEAGFTRTGKDGETAYIMYEQGEEKAETTYVARIAMDMIQLGLEPDEVTPAKVDPGKKSYDDEEEALIARFFRMDNSSYEMEWAKIEQHAFDPLKGLLQSEDFDHTWSSRSAMDEGFNMRDWPDEEYR